MNPTERTLQVLEYIMSAGPGPIKQIDIARACDLPPSTLSRIINTLSSWGYLFRTSEKYCVRNFRLERNVPLSETYLAKLDSTIRELSQNLNIAAEVVVIAGHELLWHSKVPHPDASVIMRANVGFRRSLYELDALSELYLSRLDWEDIQAQFYVDGFYTLKGRNNQQKHALSATDVKARLSLMRQEVFAADTQGNHMGICRFATVIEDSKHQFLHLLTMAEPARESPDDRTHVNCYRKVLLDARDTLQQLAQTETLARRPQPRHHVLPQQGG